MQELAEGLSPFFIMNAVKILKHCHNNISLDPYILAIWYDSRFSQCPYSLKACARFYSGTYWNVYAFTFTKTSHRITICQSWNIVISSLYYLPNLHTQPMYFEQTRFCHIKQTFFPVILQKVMALQFCYLLRFQTACQS